MRRLRELSRRARIEADTAVVVSDAPFRDILHQYSSDSDLLMLGLHLSEAEDAETFHQRYQQMLQDMPTTVLVQSNGEAYLLA